MARLPRTKDTTIVLPHETTYTYPLTVIDDQHNKTEQGSTTFTSRLYYE